MLKLHVAKGCGVTAQTLAKLISESGVEVGQVGTAHLCWGYAPAGLTEPALNAKVNRTKLYELLTLRAAGVRTVPLIAEGLPQPPDYPVLARRATHKGGTDIMLCRNEKRARTALMRGRAYFTKLVPSSTEFRVWIYRRRHLGTYEKVLTYPEKRFNRKGRRRTGRNYRNGWTFELVQAENIPRPAVDLAIAAINALSLDFGAVDILKGLDGQYYVLEINCAPGVEGENRQVIQALAGKVANWVKRGCPKRKGEQ